MNIPPEDVLVSVERGVKVWWRPKVTLLARPRMAGDWPLDVNWVDNAVYPPATHAESLTEFAGRLCYMSQHNPAEKATYDYIGDLLRQGHGSVLEHANYSMLFEGVSRSLTHELVRHRAGWAYSQLSQRYVGPEHVAFVMPLTFMEHDFQKYADEIVSDFAHALASYNRHIEGLREAEEGRESVLSRRDIRKKVQQTARAVLPNATETKIVATGNVRAWRTMLEMRGAFGAEPEIRRLAVMCYRILNAEAPAFFQDIIEVENHDMPGYEFRLDFGHHKV